MNRYCFAHQNLRRMKPEAERNDYRTTVSLAVVVWEMAEGLMDAKGFNSNFSAYVADLIRRDKESNSVALLRDAPNSVSASEAAVEAEIAGISGAGNKPRLPGGPVKYTIPAVKRSKRRDGLKRKP